MVQVEVVNTTLASRPASPEPVALRPVIGLADDAGLERALIDTAVGRLTLWSRDLERIGDDGASTLRQGGFRLLAIANPALAPYGEASRQALASLEQWEGLQGRIVMGETIGQAHALVASGNAELGLVALSYVISPRNGVPGSRWDVPPQLYEPIRQDAVLLTRAAGNDAAREFLAFLRSERAQEVIKTYGYGTE